MKLLISLLCIFSLFAELQPQPGEEVFIEELFQNPHLYVSLGSACAPATVFLHFNLRKAAFPFDWNVTTDGAKLIELLERDFSDLFNEKFLIPIDNHLGGLNLYHNYYHVEFAHDGSWTEEQFSSDLEQMKQKYQRRIDRFRKLREYKGTVYFFRHAYIHELSERPYQGKEIQEISDEDSLKLYSALKNYFPHLQFTLFILNHLPDKSEIFLEKVLSKQIIKLRCGSILHSQNSVYGQFFSNLPQWLNTVIQGRRHCSTILLK